jgi:hypothetical protein
LLFINTKKLTQQQRTYLETLQNCTFLYVVCTMKTIEEQVVV